jgi:hypothetical protein
MNQRACEMQTVSYYMPTDSIRNAFLDSLARDLELVGHEVSIEQQQGHSEFRFTPHDIPPSLLKSIYQKFRDRDLADEKEFILEAEQKHGILDLVRDGKELDIDRIKPEITVCVSLQDKRVYRYYRQLQSVPTSPGVGRRFGALVYDIGQRIPVLMGVLGFAGTTYRMSTRDEFFGWSRIDSRLEERECRNRGLRNILQLSVCLPVPPYHLLYAGKLMALLALSDDIQQYYRENYPDKKHRDKEQEGDPLLGLVTTVATNPEHAAIFNRIELSKLSGASLYVRPQCANLYKHVGHTSSRTLLMISDETTQLARSVVANSRAPAIANTRTGFRSDMSKDRVIYQALRICRISPKILNLNEKAVYFAYLHENNLKLISDYRNATKPVLALSPHDAVQYWKERWLSKAIEQEERIEHFRQFQRESLRLSNYFS